MKLEPTVNVALAKLGFGRLNSMQFVAVERKSSHVVSRLLEEPSDCRGHKRQCSFLLL